MKKSLAISSAVLVAATLVTSPAFASAPIAQASPEQAIKGFFNAELASNADVMVQFAKDDSYVDADTQRDAYQSSLQHNPLVDYKILSRVKIDESHIDFLVQQTFKDNSDPLPALTYTAFEENGNWKVLVKPYEINHIKGSPNYGKVSVRNTKQTKPESGITPHVVDAVYWNGSLNPRESRPGVNYFSMTRTDGQLTLNGWQNSAGGVAEMTYSAVRFFGSSMTTYGTQGIGSNYPQSGTWFTYYLHGIPYDTKADYQMYFSNDDGLYGVLFAGNGYE